MLFFDEGWVENVLLKMFSNCEEFLKQLRKNWKKLSFPQISCRINELTWTIEQRIQIRGYSTNMKQLHH